MAKKYSNQLIVESVIVAALLIAIVSGGIAATINIPAWQNLQNPESIANPIYDLSPLAQYYNTVLTDLGTARFQDVASLMDSFSFASIPQTVNQTALGANSQISSMNNTIASTISDFNKSATFAKLNLLINASLAFEDGCAKIGNANSTFAQFASVTTSSFS